MTRLTITSADNDGTRYQLLHDILDLYGFCNNLPVFFNGNDTLVICDNFIKSADDLVDIEGKPYDLDGIKLELNAKSETEVKNFSYKGEVEVLINRKMKVWEAYKLAYPSDSEWKYIKRDGSLSNVRFLLEHKWSIEDILNIRDSVVRERVFDMTATVCKVEYSYLYNLWLDS